MKKIIILAALVATAGCVSNKHDLDESFGAAHRANMNAQVIDPNAAAGAPQGDAAAVDIAVARYKTDKVKRPNSGGSDKKAGSLDAPQGN